MQDVDGVEWVELKEFSTFYSFGSIGFSPFGTYGPPPFPPGPTGSGHKRLEVIYINPQQIAKLWVVSELGGHGSSFSLTYAGGVNDLQ